MGDNVTCRFILPYIAQPAGSFTFTYYDEVIQANITHYEIPKLVEIITGIKYDPNNPVRIHGHTEIFKGFSEVQINLPVKNPEFSHIDDVQLRNHIAEILNEFQYCYLHFSGKYWGNPISSDHFVNMQLETSSQRGFSSNWGGSNRKIPTFLDDEQTLKKFSEFIEKGVNLPIQYTFLVDARKHYISGEYHLMYTELGIAFENLVNRAFYKISSIYEKQMFKEGKLQGQIAYILNQYCKWDEKNIEAVITICQRRNQVVHDNKRDFLHEQSYEHLTLGESAIKAISDWISA